MKIVGKLVGGLLGVFFPPFGVFLGIFLGHFFDLRSGRVREEQQIPNQSFLSGIFYFYGLCGARLGSTQGRDLLIKRQLGNITHNIFSTLEAYRAYVSGLQDGAEDPAVFLRALLAEYRIDLATRNWAAQVLGQFFGRSQGALLRELLEILGYEEAPPHQGGAYESSGDRDSSYYQILGVSPQTPWDQIKRKYRELAKKYHPDQWSGPDSTSSQQESARKKFMEIQNAYQRLKENLEGSPS